MLSIRCCELDKLEADIKGESKRAPFFNLSPLTFHILDQLRTTACNLTQSCSQN